MKGNKGRIMHEMWSIFRSAGANNAVQKKHIFPSLSMIARKVRENGYREKCTSLQMIPEEEAKKGEENVSERALSNYPPFRRRFARENSSGGRGICLIASELKSKS